MKWPPNKAWTSTSLRKGFRHFVAINYGGKNLDRWVNLVAVLDGESRLLLPWDEMEDQTKWILGWEKLCRDEANPSSDNSSSKEDNNESYEESCLHVSKDSGLLIPSNLKSLRGWN